MFIRQKSFFLTCALILVGLGALVPGWVNSLAADDAPTAVLLPDTPDPTLSLPPRHVTNPRLSTQLNAIVSAYETAGDNWHALVPTDNSLVEAHDVLVEIRTDAQNRDAVTHLLANGMRIRHHNAPGLYEAWLPVANLKHATRHPGVYFIRLARLVQFTTGAATTEGFAASNADAWHSSGYDGTGTTIAIIDSFDNGRIAGLQASGDWPMNSRLALVDVDGGGFGDAARTHGLNTVEIAYDMAPGAHFVLYEVSTVGDWYFALDAAAAAGADIVSTSLSAPQDGIGDGTALPGSIAEAAENARANGVLPINAAGNYRQQHWGGTYYSSTSSPGVHDWNGAASGGVLNYIGPSGQPGYVYCLPNGATLTFTLHWNDWTNVTQDFDLYLLEYRGSSWSQVAASIDVQDGSPGQLPQEAISYTVTNAAGGGGICSAGSGIFALYLMDYSGSGAGFNLQVYNFSSQMNYTVESHSLNFPGDSDAVVAVAAVDYATLQQEYYSSEGPRLAPGGGLAPAAGPAKPDLASFSNVRTTMAATFSGTSAAAPHVAGWAALILQQNPAFDDDALEAEMLAIAGSMTPNYQNDLGTAGHDTDYGAGLTRFVLSPTAITGVSFLAPRGTPQSATLAAGLGLLLFSLVAVRLAARRRP